MPPESTDLSNLRIGFIGAGQMASALAKGLRAANLVPADHVIAHDPVAAAAHKFQAETAGKLANSNAEVASQSEVLVLAVKPQQMSSVLDDLKGSLGDQHLVISIAAGVTLQTLSAGLGTTRRIVRVMPNTPCLVGAGASAFTLGTAARPSDALVVSQLLQTVGFAAEVPEKLLDAVTGLSGSGPAYAYLMIEALSDGGVRAGLPRDLATKLAAQTLAGAAQMVLTTGQHPGALKDAVTSPGGTTIAGLHALETGGLRGSLMNAVVAATQRARELSSPS